MDQSVARQLSQIPRPERCPACPLRTPTVGSSGPKDARMVIVGESPGAQEVAYRRPFVGDSGRLLRTTFPKDIDADSIMITNSQLCLPSKEKDAKKLAECCRACHERLYEEIAAYPRTVILAVGNGALWSLTGDYTLKITQERGKIFPTPLASQGIVAAYHPAFVLRGANYKIFREDVQYAFHLFRGGERKIPAEYSYQLMDPSRVSELHNLLKENGYVGADIETSGLNPRRDRILCLGVNVGGDCTYIIRGSDLLYFVELFDDPSIKWIWHNGKFDTAFLNQLGIPARVDEDTMLLNYSLNEVGGIHDLESIAGNLLGAPDYKDKVTPYIQKGDSGFESVPESILFQYRLAPDCGYTYKSWQILRRQVAEDEHLDKLYRRILIPASDMLRHVEARGFYVHRDQLQRNFDHYEGNASKEIPGVVPSLCAEINEHVHKAGYTDINPNSWQQVSMILYDVLKLSNKYKSRSTAEEILKLNTPHHPIIDALLKYREVAKAYGTYVKGISRHIEQDGCIHSTYKIHGTRTGRLSSSDPNLQNIPRDPVLRSQFGARPGHVLLEFDLDQAELRCLAALSGDPTLCSIYESNSLSLHKEVSEWLWGNNWKERYAIGEEEGGKQDPVFLKAYDEYMRTKALNFGIVYGRTGPSIAEEFKVSFEEADSWIGKWFTRFPLAKEYIDACRRAPTQGKTLVTPFGRKKRFGAVSFGRIHSLQNEAANFPHQSCASDITLYTAIKVYKELERYAAYIVNLVHDSLIVECPDDPHTIERVREIVEPELVESPTEWGLDKIPFKTDCKIGTQWGLCKTI
jgi:uracil-DNA glycosylase family 4